MPPLDAPVPLLTTLGLMAAMAAKHYVVDFVAQTAWMARGKERARGWAAPLAVHAGLHAGGTLAVALLAAPALWWLAAIDFVVHGSIDRAKSVIGHRTRWTTTDSRFWWLMGFDQFLHQVTNVGLVAALLVG